MNEQNGKAQQTYTSWMLKWLLRLFLRVGQLILSFLLHIHAISFDLLIAKISWVLRMAFGHSECRLQTFSAEIVSKYGTVRVGLGEVEAELSDAFRIKWLECDGSSVWWNVLLFSYYGLSSRHEHFDNLTWIFRGKIDIQIQRCFHPSLEMVKPHIKDQEIPLKLKCIFALTSPGNSDVLMSDLKQLLVLTNPIVITKVPSKLVKTQ